MCIHPFWSRNGRNLYFATQNEDGTGFTAIMRQPFDSDSGGASGPPVEFYSLQGLSLAEPVVNQVIGATGGMVVALLEESSDIWSIDLRK
jgi:Tol biopolymer transport system component